VETLYKWDCGRIGVYTNVCVEDKHPAETCITVTDLNTNFCVDENHNSHITYTIYYMCVFCEWHIQ